MKRGSSGLSLIVGIDKPLGMSSHDVVNRCRRVFGEKRVGHAGTLDPLASGVLLLCIGPATRLNPYLAMADKRYRFKISFGRATDTDDSEGTVIREGDIPDEVLDPFFAAAFVRKLVGSHQQTPPLYSAVKVRGERSYQSARKGNIIPLDARAIEIYEASLLSIGECENANTPGGGSDPFWEVEVHVSKGTYIRSLARDIGNALGVPAHVSELRRLASGTVTLSECCSIESLEEQKDAAVLDPVALLGLRMIFVNGEETLAVRNGSRIPSEGRKIFSLLSSGFGERVCSCSPGILESGTALEKDEMISVVSGNRLLALYQFDPEAPALISRCVFSVGVARGTHTES